MSSYGKFTRKQRKQAQTVYDSDVYNILNNRRTVSAKKIRAEAVRHELSWVSCDGEEEEYTIYSPEEKETLENHRINLGFEERLVFFYGEDEFEIRSLAETARYKQVIHCELTEKEQAALNEEEQVAGIEERRAELLKACDDRGLLPEKLSKEEIERQQTAAKFAEALGLQVPTFDNQLPSNEVLIARIAAGRVEDGADVSDSLAALPDKAVEIPDQLKLLVADAVKQVLDQRSDHRSSGNQGGGRNKNGRNKDSKQSGKAAKAENEQKPSQPSPDDFDDQEQDQSQGQNQSQPTTDDFPFTLDANGCIPGLDKKATAGILQQYEAAKKQSAGEGGNA